MRLWNAIKKVAKKIFNFFVGYIKKTDAPTIAKNVVGVLTSAVSSAISLKFLHDRIKALRIMQKANQQETQKQQTQKAPIDYGLNLGSSTQYGFDHLDPKLKAKLDREFAIKRKKKSKDYKKLDKEARRNFDQIMSMEYREPVPGVDDKYHHPYSNEIPAIFGNYDPKDIIHPTEQEEEDLYQEALRGIRSQKALEKLKKKGIPW